MLRKKIKKLLLLGGTLVVVSTSAFAKDESSSIFQFILPAYVETKCFKAESDNHLLVLDEKYVNESGNTYAPLSCKGKICWSWEVHPQNPWNYKIFDSTIPVSIKNSEKLTKSIVSTIKETSSLRKNVNNVISAAVNTVQADFSIQKERGTAKEKSSSQAKTKEEGIDINVTQQFHRFLAIALHGYLKPDYHFFCISSAVDLVLKAVERDRTQDLIQAYILFKTVKPEDIDFDSSSSILNRTKFLYSVFPLFEEEDYYRKRASWAQALLFSHLLEWEEFSSVKQKVDAEIKRAYADYVALKKYSIEELEKKNKDLARAAFYAWFMSKNEKDPVKKRDFYIHISITYPEMKNGSEDFIQKIDMVWEFYKQKQPEVLKEKPKI
ncbi:hypothetical protein [Thermodesulfobacterium thermophilum]|uniref:hypothetical protein n=1 Tax=Thermodesulfobacterium thermophilum TaxID=886 RepID=UPI0003B39F98|nr:hypothetical protein [Thermodesulfobacterium thermophilum]